MKIVKVITGSLRENCYILINNNDCLVIDPGDDFQLIEEEIKKYNLCGILITHYHFDHIGALDELLNYKNVPIYDYKLNEKEYEFNSFKFKIIKTPGHTDDSVTFYFYQDNTMFTGDFLFKESIGRTDLETGDDLKMSESIKKIKAYNDNITIYPGHGDISTLGYEFINNYFLMR